MEEMLSAIGFSNINSKEKLSEMLQEVVNSPNLRYIVGKDAEELFVEYVKYFGNGIGIAIRGSFDKDDKIIVESWAPYVETSNLIEIAEVDIDVNDDKEYFAVCEEEQTGNEIEFYLQNVVDFLNVEDDDDAAIIGAYMVGLALEGTIILPIKKDPVDKVLELEQNKFYRTLVKLMKQGDNEAEQILQIQQDEMTETISERLNKEDLFSVIEGYFSADTEQELTYNILGDIQKIETIKNKTTDETIYKFNVNAMGIIIDICVNENNLLGVPMIGMRFKGKCWIQGKLVFD